ncbi:uroporphyrinogen-III synthase [Tamaricihabitans halophyticus]|uniref:Uroporphyrinogen-III synthase n=1 Tax=Tamaricihabitans halophyticus TaxID=1262583 RepID=A0A4R2QKA2_9PSEU|nr:uroporphyrinogen-III synthase [Tamaricihabitans halophyticus]TCP49259.1 uroporphyrinogen-III synthase [Tamaricihabitans halophyticus]
MVETSSLAGRMIGVTAERRAADLCTSLERRGASVWHAPAMHTVPLPDDPRLRATTERVLAEPVDLVVFTTGMGMRGWVDAAHQWGQDEALLATLERADIYVRGPKAKGAVRGAGLREHASAESESNAELFELVQADDLAGKRVVVQLHGVALPEYVDALRAAGAEVLQVLPYRWEPPRQPELVHALLDGVRDRRVDALTFTSAAAASGLLDIARTSGRLDGLLSAVRDGMVAACVGPITAAPLIAEGMAVVQPARWRLGALVNELEASFS